MSGQAVVEESGDVCVVCLVSGGVWSLSECWTHVVLHDSNF